MAFFYPRPSGLQPTLDRLFVAFARATGRPLGAPAQAAQQATDVVRMVDHTPAPQDQIRHTRTGPQVGREATGRRTLEQPAFELSTLLIAELPGPSGSRPGRQPGLALLLERGAPAPDRTPIDTDLAGDVNWSQALLQ